MTCYLASCHSTPPASPSLSDREYVWEKDLLPVVSVYVVIDAGGLREVRHASDATPVCLPHQHYRLRKLHIICRFFHIAYIVQRRLWGFRSNVWCCRNPRVHVHVSIRIFAGTKHGIVSIGQPVAKARPFCWRLCT